MSYYAPDALDEFFDEFFDEVDHSSFTNKPRELVHIYNEGSFGLEPHQLNKGVAPLMLKINQVFGLRARDWQESAFHVLLEGHDLIVKAAPGKGKSLVFLGMTQVREGAIVLVIVPLLSIMNDQVDPFESYETNFRSGNSRDGKFLRSR